MKKLNILIVNFILILFAISPVFAQHPTSTIQSISDNYNATFLGTLGGDYGIARSINNSGQIVGYDTLYEGSGNYGFLYQNGSMTNLGSGWVNDINDSGVIVGQNGIYQNGSFQNIGFMASGINDSGQVVGYDSNNAYLYDNGTTTNLGSLGSGRVIGSDINNSTQMVGTYYNGTEWYERGAFLYENGVMTDVGSFGGADNEAFAINDLGNIVGHSSYFAPGNQRAFAKIDGVMTDINPTGMSIVFSGAMDINNLNYVVGVIDTGVAHPFIWIDGVMYDIGIPYGYREAGAYGINDQGQIVGYAVPEFGSYHAFLWDPVSVVPEPVSSTLFIVGGATLGFRRFRKKFTK